MYTHGKESGICDSGFYFHQLVVTKYAYQTGSELESKNKFCKYHMQKMSMQVPYDQIGISHELPTI